MKPKFKNEQAWEQAQLLMQPAFIRVVDNLRKELEDSIWNGTYEEVQEPLPSYHLCLTSGDKSFVMDIWQICFKVCFVDYPAGFIEPNTGEFNTTHEVDIDPTLFDEQGEINWQILDDKTQTIIKNLFAQINPS